MSLLMQALKKAERAKQNLVPEEELAKPSEAFDEVLELSPQEGVAPAPPQVAAPAPMDLSLSPIDEPPPAIPSLEFALDPAPPSLPPRAEPHMADTGLEFVPEPPPSARPAPEAPRAAAPKAPRNAPPATKRSSPVASRASLDPRTIRLVLLGLMLFALLGTFAYIYWQAVYGKGSSKNLPMVAMPGQPNAGTAASAPPVLVPGAAAPLAGTPAAAAAPSPDPAFAAAPPQRPAPVRSVEAPPPAQLPATPAPPQPEALAAPVGAPDNDAIKIARSSTPERVDPTLQSGYLMFNAGKLAAARDQFQQVLRKDPNNRDALLGEAASAIKEHQPAQAEAAYQRLLELDPNDSDAIAGMIGLRQADPGQSESRLRRVLQRSPESGPALFALGNLYATQRRWPEAQQMYFRAVSAAPANADYAFNLAVGLDRLNQGRLALTYYERALSLGQNGSGNFDRAAVQNRMQELGAQ